MAAATRTMIAAALMVLLNPFSLASAAGPGCTDFIRKSCASTLHATLCYSSLAKYPCAGGPNPTKIAHYAANLSLAQASSISRHVSVLHRSPGELDHRTAAALSDCADTLRDAVDLLSQAATELDVIAMGDSPELSWHVSNAQTWISAALTNEDTCADGFANSGAGEGGGATSRAATVSKDITKRVGRAMQYTSNALALVNRLAA